jgi:hypothetical protein
MELFNAWRQLVEMAEVRKAGDPRCALTNAVYQLSRHT